MLKITYGASFGTSENPISEQMLEMCKRLSSRFDAISVREKSAVGLVEQYFGKHAELVLDPTLLLGADDYVIERPKLHVQRLLNMIHLSVMFLILMDKRRKLPMMLSAS